jgi:hypothetical protein
MAMGQRFTLARRNHIAVLMSGTFLCRCDNGPLGGEICCFRGKTAGFGATKARPFVQAHFYS